MSEEIPSTKQDELAVAVAQGKSVAAWARQNDVPIATAYRWAKDPDLRRQVQDWRRRCLDRALGEMASHSRRAARAMVQLSENADSDSVRLVARQHWKRQEPSAGRGSRVQKPKSDTAKRPKSDTAKRPSEAPEN
jgi:hypothetical protein